MFGVNCKTPDIFTVNSLSLAFKKVFFIIIIFTQVVHEYVFLGDKKKKKRTLQKRLKVLWPLSASPVVSPETDSQFGTYPNLILSTHNSFA